MTWWQQLIAYLICALGIYAAVREGRAPRPIAIIAGLLWPVVLIYAGIRFALRRRFY